MGNKSNLLGDNFKSYVNGQIKIRQNKLGKQIKTNEEIVWENAKTAYVALASSVNIQNNPIYNSLVSLNFGNPGGEFTQIDTSTPNSTDTFSATDLADLRNFNPEVYGGLTDQEIQDLFPSTTTTDSNKEAISKIKITYVVPLPPEEIKYVASQVNTGIKGIDVGNKNEPQVIAALQRVTTQSQWEQVKKYYRATYTTDDGDIEESLSDDGINKTDYTFLPDFEIDGRFATISVEGYTPEQVAAAVQFKKEEAEIRKKYGYTTQAAKFINEAYESSGLTFVQRQDLEEATTAIQEIDNQNNRANPLNNSYFFKEEFIDTGKFDTSGDRRLQSLGIGNEYSGNSVAQHLVLTSGTTFISGDNIREYKAGVADNLSIFNNFVYGFGGDKEWGLTAMPGLESVDIMSKNMGSLREATVKLRANSETQFSLIDSVYCRIGYTMFLEWGHSVYFNNEGEYISSPMSAGVQSLLPIFLKGGKTTSYLQEQIEKNRRISTGNYDAFAGRVTNFTWDFNREGYYDITLKIVSIGDIVESLQIDQPLGDTLINSSNASDSIQPNDVSSLSKFLSIAAQQDGNGIYQERYSILGNWWETFTTSTDILTNTFKNFKRQLVANNSMTFKSQDYVYSALYGNALLRGITSTLGLNKLYGLGSNGEYEVATITTEASDYSQELKYKRPATSMNLKFDGVGKITSMEGKIISGRATFGEHQYQYIRFGDILDFINERLLIYNSIENEPIIRINTEVTANLCYYSGVNMSADPSKVMVKVPIPLPTEKLKGYANRKDGNGNPIWPHNLNQKQVYNHPDFALLEEFVTDEGFFSNNGTEISGINAGQIMNIYFEYDYLMGEISSNRDEKSKSLKLYDFIDSLLKTANSCLGGVNALTQRLVDDNVLTIYDQNPIYGAQLDFDVNNVLNLYGVKGKEGSFVRDFSITTEITSEFAAQVTIGAQAQGSSNTTDSTALSNWNYGLIDRWLPRKLSGDEKDGNKDKSISTYKRIIGARDKLMFMWLGYAEGKKGRGVTPATLEQKILTRQQQDNAKIALGTSNLLDTNNINNPNLTTKQYQDIVDGLQLDFIVDQEGYIFKHFPTKRYSEFVKIQQDFLALLHIQSDVNTNQQGMIPLNIGATLEGLSGIRIYDQLPVDTRFIPNYYPQTLLWIIKGVSHNITGDQWTTRLETIAVPKVPKLNSSASPTTSTTSYKQYTTIPWDDITDGVDEPTSEVPISSAGTTPPEFRDWVSNGDLHPWSAAFVSYIVKEAGVSFPYNASHTGYSIGIRDDRSTRVEQSVYEDTPSGGTTSQVVRGTTSKYPWRSLPINTPIQKGDIIVRNRAGNSNIEPTSDWKGQLSHGAIVTNVYGTKVTTIGGNEGNTVKSQALDILDTNGKLKLLKGNGSYFAILRPNNPQDAQKIVTKAQNEFQRVSERTEQNPLIAGRLQAYWKAVGINTPDPGVSLDGSTWDEELEKAIRNSGYTPI